MSWGLVREAKMSWKGTLWLALSSFDVSFVLVLAAVHYLSFFMAFLALWFFNLGTTLHFAYRLPKLGEGFADEKRRAEADNEYAFFLALFYFNLVISVLLLSALSGLQLYIAFSLVMASILLHTAVVFYDILRAW